MNLNVISLFPEIIADYASKGVLGRAVSKSLIKLNYLNPRNFTDDKYQTVDDRPFGGGDGMLMLYEPLARTLESIDEQNKGPVIYLSAQGNIWNQKKAEDWVGNHQNITLISGRYGGIDQRVINDFVDEEVSIGDFILSGGELAACIIIDSCARLIPGVLGNNVSCKQDSFSMGILESPGFTRPQTLGEKSVPSALLSGHHEKINEFRKHLSIAKTYIRRPDLIESAGIKPIDVKKALVELSVLPVEELEVCGFNLSELERINEIFSK